MKYINLQRLKIYVLTLDLKYVSNEISTVGKLRGLDDEKMYQVC